MYPSPSSIILQIPSEHGLVLKHGLFDIVRNWTVEPDVAFADTIGLRHGPLTEPQLILQDQILFRSGALNMLFMSHPLGNANGTRVFHDGRQSLCRPYFKTTRSGFKWFSMTKLPGVALNSLWEPPYLFGT
jgi:hypothetical protein